MDARRIEPSFMHALILLVAAPSVLALWPAPRTLQTGSSFVKLASSFDIDVQVDSPPQDLIDAVSRTKDHLSNDKLGRLIVGRGSNDSDAVNGAPELSSLKVSLEDGANVLSIAEEAVKPIGERIEGYALSMAGDGSSATLTANSTLGLFRGLTTFGQLFYDLSGTTYTYQAPISIEDSPAFPYRGLMLDTSRNYFPVKDIKRTIDAMSMVKINTFHWHIVDSQSFPLEVPEFPEISAKGAYSPDEIYSTDDVEDIVSYAGARGVDVLVEIDTPGHTSVISQSHPEHIACPDASPWSTYAAEPPSGQLRLASPATASFTQSLLAAVAKRLPSALFSTGGDEVNTQCYEDDAQTQNDLASSGKTLEGALGDFVVGNHDALRKVGKTPVVWEEMLLDHKIDLGNDTVVLVWISSDNAAKVAAAGFRFVHAPSDYFYLDCGAGEWIGVTPDATSWCDPFKSWQHAYTFDPLKSIPADQQHLVLGGQQLLWAEQSSPTNLDPIVWPRAAASAEVFWTGASAQERDVREALARLHDVRFRMVQRGIGAIALQPFWCALRAGRCDTDS